MSRRRGEFEHRTSIFEGAFRAWSHLGGLEPEELESRPAADLDPLTTPLENDTRLKGNKGKKSGEEVPRNPDGSKRREYPYEPLPRSGLAHPYVQAILSPWLGPDADNEAIQLGLTTLRTWWQHRRKGESGSAIAALGTEKMKGVVEGYTRHFFTLAHCLIINDKEQPPRTLHSKMKELDKLRNKRNKKRAREDEDSKLTALALNGGFGGASAAGSSNEQAQIAAGINDALTDTTLSPLERLHAAQRRQLAESGGIHTSLPGVGGSSNGVGGGAADVSALPPVVNLKGKCVPGKLDLPGIVDTVSHHAAQLSHRGASYPAPVTSSSSGPVPPEASSAQYGDPSIFPVVFISDKGDIQIAMTVDGITCAHCVKIVETVLKGCNGNKSPIDGLLDAAADRVLCSVLIRIDHPANAKRVAFEAARNLAMVGYTAKAKEMSIADPDDKNAAIDLNKLSQAFEAAVGNKSESVFGWHIPCTCPDNGILRDDCSRHSQMNSHIFEAFEARAQQVKEFMAGSGQKFSIQVPVQSKLAAQNQLSMQQQQQQQALPPQQQMAGYQQDPYNALMGGGGGGPPPQIATNNNNMNQYGDSLGGGMNGYGGAQHPGMNVGNMDRGGQLSPLGNEDDMGMPSVRVEMPMRQGGRRASRNPSIISFGGVRGMSVTSEATFGRAMSGLSALSIDWENLEDFDVNVDHSAHINNSDAGVGPKKDIDAHEV